MKIRSRHGWLARIWVLPVALLTLGAGKLGPHEKAIQATTEIPESQLLDVSNEVFDPVIHDLTTLTPKQKEGIYPEVRRSEARYVPMQLKETLQATGFWGAVRVVPEGTSSAEVTITGLIVKSTGKDLVVEVEVADISGRELLSKK